MTAADSAAVSKAREGVQVALQRLANSLTDEPFVVSQWCADVEVISGDGEKHLLLMTSANASSWGILGLMMGGFRVAQDLLQA